MKPLGQFQASPVPPFSEHLFTLVEHFNSSLPNNCLMWMSLYKSFAQVLHGILPQYPFCSAKWPAGAVSGHSPIVQGQAQDHKPM